MNSLMEDAKAWASAHITAIRWSIVVAMLLIGFWGLVLGYRFVSNHYIVADTGGGRFLGYFLVKLGPELAGIVIGVVAIDALNDWRQDKQLKEQTILQMGSRHTDVTDTAVSTLRARGWLEDGSLKGAFLEGASLQEAYLWGADLQGALLERANLRGAFLHGANLQGAFLGAANLQGAYLEEANLEGAVLEDATGQGAILEMANLEGTIMPDGIKLKGADSPNGLTYKEWLTRQDSQEQEM